MSLRIAAPFVDAFADAAETDDSGKDYVHIRIQQRNGKKSLTTIQVRPRRFVFFRGSTRRTEEAYITYIPDVHSFGVRRGYDCLGSILAL